MTKPALSRRQFLRSTAKVGVVEIHGQAMQGRHRYDGAH